MSKSLQLVKTGDFEGIKFDCYQDSSKEFWGTREQIGKSVAFRTQFAFHIFYDFGNAAVVFMRAVRHEQIEFRVFLDFDADLYGRKIEVAFLKRIRGEKKFADLQQLRTQMADDERHIRELNHL